MNIISVNSEPALKSNPPQYWVFSWSLPAAINSVLRDKRSKFAIKRSWPRSKTFIKVQHANLSKPVPEVCGMIWISEDIIVEDMTLPSHLRHLSHNKCFCFSLCNSVVVCFVRETRFLRHSFRDPFHRRLESYSTVL